MEGAGEEPPKGDGEPKAGGAGADDGIELPNIDCWDPGGLGGVEPNGEGCAGGLVLPKGDGFDCAPEDIEKGDCPGPDDIPIVDG